VVAGLSAWGSRTLRAARVAHGPSENQVRTVRVSGCSSGRYVAINGPSGPCVADRPPGDSRPSAPGSRTVRQGVRKTSKSFASLSFAFALGSFGVCS
jgi:hypothetical protein